MMLRSLFVIPAAINGALAITTIGGLSNDVLTDGRIYSAQDIAVILAIGAMFAVNTAACFFAMFGGKK